jgi:hypothetical protein
MPWYENETYQILLWLSKLKHKKGFFTGVGILKMSFKECYIQNYYPGALTKKI